MDDRKEGIDRRQSDRRAGDRRSADRRKSERGEDRRAGDRRQNERRNPAPKKPIRRRFRQPCCPANGPDAENRGLPDLRNRRWKAAIAGSPLKGIMR